MKNYSKPVIFDEYIEIDDIVLMSPTGVGDQEVIEGGDAEEGN